MRALGPLRTAAAIGATGVSMGGACGSHAEPRKKVLRRPLNSSSLDGEMLVSPWIGLTGLNHLPIAWHCGTTMISLCLQDAVFLTGDPWKVHGDFSPMEIGVLVLNAVQAGMGCAGSDIPQRSPRHLGIVDALAERVLPWPRLSTTRRHLRGRCRRTRLGRRRGGRRALRRQCPNRSNARDCRVPRHFPKDSRNRRTLRSSSKTPRQHPRRRHRISRRLSTRWRTGRTGQRSVAGERQRKCPPEGATGFYLTRPIDPMLDARAMHVSTAAKESNSVVAGSPTPCFPMWICHGQRRTLGGVLGPLLTLELSLGRQRVHHGVLLTVTGAVLVALRKLDLMVWAADRRSLRWGCSGPPQAWTVLGLFGFAVTWGLVRTRWIIWAGCFCLGELRPGPWTRGDADTSSVASAKPSAPRSGENAFFVLSGPWRCADTKTGERSRGASPAIGDDFLATVGTGVADGSSVWLLAVLRRSSRASGQPTHRSSSRSPRLKPSAIALPI